MLNHIRVVSCTVPCALPCGQGGPERGQCLRASTVVSPQAPVQLEVCLWLPASYAERIPLPTSTQLLVPHATQSLGCPELTHAVLARGIRLVAQVADAAVAPTQVLAHAVGADVWVEGTFIDVCTEKEVKLDWTTPNANTESFHPLILHCSLVSIASWGTPLQESLLPALPILLV